MLLQFKTYAFAFQNSHLHNLLHILGIIRAKILATLKLTFNLK